MHSGDIVAADRSFTDHLQDDEYLHSDQCKFAEDLIVAFKNSNEEAVQVAIASNSVTYLDNQVGRLTRKLSIYGSKKQVQKKHHGRPSKKVEEQSERLTVPTIDDDVGDDEIDLR